MENVFAQTKIYEVCLPDWPAVIPKVCEMIGLSDATASYQAAKSAFENSREETQDWTIQGSTGCSFSVKFEQYEGYLFGKLTGRGSAFSSVAELLWETYIAQGGNPDAQEQP